MSKYPKHPAPRPKPQLCCDRCGTDSDLFISSITPPSPGSGDPVIVSYTCTRCWVAYRQVADPAEFAGALNVNEGPQDVLVFGGQYIHCRQAMRETGLGVLCLDGRTADEKSGNPLQVRLEIRLLECPCGFRLVLPDERT
ncbi:hypothetical protein SAMN05660473_04165 [Arthrobacter sp. 49Tsu3.1M3]|uniref:hypothetical protein n=1 Tax=Arthrobacter sp. 49Tsu3.1M3 TaxID=1279029 RepID=UPI0009A76648|nr:hypothetical protein [Arthrobacter sp. 49Tsu3.1M3]SKC10083.1 hypothetical protein SAMN05660473_04165 [Arthrobacter sp. 49Tsu3.1M3]